ncbi:GGDEF domain-containing protein [Bacillus pinisoli]|uniref:GGDEF domain-containing protein n=1 Tax=Bacillus pinisoli TaxID=2901866 RepID=UPI001FF5D969|nr:diguanylate cyclase [Bacillus pinisoli]
MSFTFIWHQIFQNNRLTFQSPILIKVLDGLIAGLLGIILMHYSIQVNADTILDLRHIPVILVSFFGGFLPTIVAAFVISIGRFFISYNLSAFVSLGMMIIVAIGASLISYKVKASNWKKWMILLFFSQFCFSVALYIVVTDYQAVLNYAFFHIISTIIGGILTFYFVLYIRRNTELFNLYKENSERDSLTGLYNVRSFDRYYNSMLAEAKSNHENCAICLFDIDYFKQINDTHGHPAGDEVIKQFALLLSQLTRNGDIVSRNGGEEFSVLLPGCSLLKAEEIAERIRMTAESRWFTLPNRDRIKLTVSAGIAVHDQTDDISDTDYLYQQADDALYKAKQNGRNRVMMATTTV